MTNRTNHSEVIRDFLKSSEFSDIISSLIKRDSDKLKEKIDELKEEVTNLKESNIQLIHLLCNGVQATDEKRKTIENISANDQQSRPTNIEKQNPTMGKNFTNKHRLRSTTKQIPDKQKTFENDNENVFEALREKTSSTTYMDSGDKADRNENNDGEWQAQKPRRKNNIIFGRANNNNSFVGVTRYIDFHVFRCPLDMTSVELENYLKTKNILNTKCEKMKSKYPEIYTSFKVSVPANFTKQFTDPEIWPEYVGVNRFNSRFLRRGPTITEEHA
ncbi:hypothetical protein JTB14_032339 [Gonioctena quinquepunctata]|nr:hypothetical protein JTB14_032339 [Gonioctena quinquepunctata]